MDTSWHDSKQLNTAAKAFHDRYARQPCKLECARRMHIQFFKEIENYLKSEDLCSRIEYSGSTFDGTTVSNSFGDDDSEFDVIVVMREGRKLEANQVKPGYANLQPRAGMEGSLRGILSYKGMFTYQCAVDSVKVLETFFEPLQICIKASSVMQGKVKLCKDGPTAHMEVYPNSGHLFWGEMFYSVDVVPAFEVSGCLYLARPLKKEHLSKISWCQSFSVEEKLKLDAADQSNGCQKHVFRILKVIRNREYALRQLTPDHLKTALFHEMDRGLDWTYRDVGKRLMGVLGWLDQALTWQTMQHYFMREFNLLGNMSSIMIQTIRDRIHLLCTNENQMMLTLRVQVYDTQAT